MGMEDETRGFLVLIANTIALILIWMIANVLIGIYFGLAFFEGRPAIRHIVYYIFFVVSIFFLIKYLKKKWKM